MDVETGGNGKESDRIASELGSPTSCTTLVHADVAQDNAVTVNLPVVKEVEKTLQIFSAKAQTPSERAVLTWLCYAAMVTVAFPMALLPLILTELQREFALDDEQAGQVMSMGFLGVVVAIVVVSPLADRMGSKPFILLGAAAGGLGFLVQTYATSGTEIVVSAFLEGFGVAQSEMLMSPIIAVMYPDDRTTAMQWLHSAYSIGSFGTMVGTALALHQEISWRVVTAIVAVAYGVVGLAFLSQRIPAIVADHSGVDEPIGTVVRSRPFWVAFGLFTLGGAAGAGPSTWIPAYFETVRGFGRAQSDLVMLAFSLLTACGRVLAGRLSATLGHVSLLGHAGLASAGVLALAVGLPSAALAAGFAAVAGLTMSAFWPTSLAIASDCHPSGGAKMYGILFIGGNLGGGIMSWLVGAVSERLGLALGFLTCAGPPLALSAIYFANRNFLKPSSPSPQLAASSPTNAAQASNHDV